MAKRLTPKTVAEEARSAVSKDGHSGASWFETREDALLTMRLGSNGAS